MKIPIFYQKIIACPYNLYVLSRSERTVGTIAVTWSKICFCCLLRQITLDLSSDFNAVLVPIAKNKEDPIKTKDQGPSQHFPHHKFLLLKGK